MKYRVFILFIFISLISIVLQSCSSTKFVPDGEYLLASAKVKTDTKDVPGLEMESYLKQKPNFRTFSLFKFPLSLYNLSGKDTTKWINRILRDAGEAPVIYDSTMIDKSVSDLERTMINRGYLNAKVTSSVKLENKRAKVTYHIESNEPYRIHNYKIEVKDSIIDNNIIPAHMLSQRAQAKLPRNFSMSTDSVLARNTLVKKKDLFNFTKLDKERDRITSIFRRAGYYGFDKEYIGFVVDTTLGHKNVDLELSIYPSAQRGRDGGIIEGAHQRYVVNEVDIYVDFNPVTDGDIRDYQTSSVYESGDYTIHYGPRGRYIKPQAILDNCYIRPGSLYNEDMVSMTYNAITQLRILKNVNISFTEVVENDSTKLRCLIVCVPDKRQGFSAEAEGTNSGEFFGLEGSLGYLHRNAFKGSEAFNIRLRGAYDAISASFSDFSKNYFEIGGETSLTFPRFMFPLLSTDFKRTVHASTQFSADYTFQRRPEYFTRTVLSSRLKYIWQGRRSSSARHVVNLIDVSYIHIPNLNEDFKQSLTVNALKYSFTDQFILGTGYTYSKSNLVIGGNTRYGQPISSVRASIETAGNLLSLIGNITKAREDDEGSKEIFGTKFAQYVRGTVDYSQTIHIDEKNSIAWHIGGGLAYPYGNFKEIPIQKRFYSGGANSVRGWAVRELGPGSFFPSEPKYDNFFYHSGDVRLDANIEYRSKLFWILELGAFIDAGNIWTVKKNEGQDYGNFQLSRFYKEIALAWGLGLRFDFDFVLVRVDCGWKAYDPAINPKESKWRIAKPFRLGDNTAWHIAVGYPF